MALQKEKFNYRDFALNIYSEYKDNQATKMFLEIILSITTLIVFALFALRPTILTIIELVKQVQAKEELVEVMDQKIQSLSRAQSNYFQNQTSITNLEQALPTGARPEEVVYQVQGILLRNSVNSIDSVAAQNVDVKVADPAKVSKLTDLPENTGAVEINVSTDANYRSVESVIEDILALRIPISIDRLDIVQRTNFNDPTQLQDTLSVDMAGKTIYFLGGSR